MLQSKSTNSHIEVWYWYLFSFFQALCPMEMRELLKRLRGNPSQKFLKQPKSALPSLSKRYLDWYAYYFLQNQSNMCTYVEEKLKSCSLSFFSVLCWNCDLFFSGHHMGECHSFSQIFVFWWNKTYLVRYPWTQQSKYKHYRSLRLHKYIDGKTRIFRLYPHNT